jgi:hypothetical protein
MVSIHLYRPYWFSSRTFKNSSLLQDDLVITGSYNQPHVCFDNNRASTKLRNKLYSSSDSEYAGCDDADSSMHYAMKFNVTDEFHLLDTSSVQDARGAIIVSRGSENQASDVEINISTAYASPYMPEVLHSFDPPANTLRLSYTSTKCIQVKVVISLRPDVRKKLRHFSMTTEMLELSMEPSLAWTVDNLSIHTTHGGISFSGAAGAYENLVTHNVTASSATGEIFGYFVADANLHLRNEAGTIGVFLIPRLQKDIPLALESITATTMSGDLFVDMYAFGEPPRPDHIWPMQPFTHSAHFHSDTGCVRASIPMGIAMNFTSGTSDLAVILIPFGAADKHVTSDLRTDAKRGTTYVHVWNTLQKSLGNGRFDPLLSLRSRHKVENGSMMIRYPYSWYGELEGMINKGELEFDGSSLSHVEKGDGWVKATRGKGASFMESWVEEGDLDIKIGLGL